MADLLVIDDEPRIVDFVSRALHAHGFTVERASGGQQGTELAKTGHYALVVLDLRMPGRDGFAVLRETLAVQPQQRFLVLSALADVETRVRALELGASDFLAKPFALAELVARVGAQLRRPGRDARIVRAAGIVLDLDRRTADCGAGPVALAGREFVLLQHLIEHRGSVCSREELLRDVWGCPFDPGTNVVDVYIRRLRAKLGAEIVTTVRHVGYCLDAA